jgi:hypothetical protein
LPQDLTRFGISDWKLVNYYYGIWTKKDETGESILDHILAKLVELERYEAGRNPLPSMFIVDLKSFKNADAANEIRIRREKNFWHKDSYSRRRPWAA